MRLNVNNVRIIQQTALSVPKARSSLRENVLRSVHRDIFRIKKGHVRHAM